MKARTLAVLFGLLVSMNASASWFGFNNNNNYYDDNSWPEWTPMYWMEEMMGGWDNDDNYRYGPYGYAPNPYMAQPYGYQSYMPYGAQPQQPYVQAPVAPQAALPAPVVPQAK